VSNFEDEKKSDKVKFTLTSSSPYSFLSMTMTWTGIADYVTAMSLPNYPAGSLTGYSTFTMDWTSNPPALPVGANSVFIQFSTSQNGKKHKVTDLEYIMRDGSGNTCKLVVK